ARGIHVRDEHLAARGGEHARRGGAESRAAAGHEERVVLDFHEGVLSWRGERTATSGTSFAHAHCSHSRAVRSANFAESLSGVAGEIASASARCWKNRGSSAARAIQPSAVAYKLYPASPPPRTPSGAVSPSRRGCARSRATSASATLEVPPRPVRSRATTS